VTVRVLLVEDHPMYAAGLRATLGGDPRMTVVGLVGDVAAARAAVHDLRPDVLVLDLSLPDGSGLTLLSEVASQTPVLVLTSHDDDQHVYAALRAGARGYLVKTAAADELVRAVHDVAAGSGVFAGSVVERITRHVASGGRASHDELFPELSPRERDVLRLIANGHSNAYIADHFVLSLKTVRNHVSNVLVKIGAASRAEAVARARDAGLV
jgi:DNA-binding NarL/FixJ family response regulator